MGSGQRIPEKIRREAARWITERDAGLLTEEDELALAAWLAADPRHAEAHARLEGTWRAIGSPLVETALREQPSALTFSTRAPPRQWLGGAIAASLVLAIVGGMNDWPTHLRADAMTQTGEQRELTLTDGSIVQLNTGSAVAIDYHDDRRIVRLLKGEAAFTVAADRARPFTVEAGNGSTTALGTRFLVRREDADTDVTVTEHSVRVLSPVAAQASEPGVVVKEGQSIRYGAAGISQPHAVDIEQTQAWTRGLLVFVDRPLGEVVAELNRYHPGHIRVVGDDLAGRRFNGVFPVDDPIGAVETIQRSLGIGSTRFTNRLIFLHS